MNPFDKKSFDKAVDRVLEQWAPKPKAKEPTGAQFQFIKDKLGYPGVMLSGSKRAKTTKGREHLTVFNGNLVLGDGYGKVWFGDIDIAKQWIALGRIAAEFKTTLYVLREMDARFGNENNPVLENAVYKTDGVNESFDPRFEKVGKLILRKTH